MSDRTPGSVRSASPAGETAAPKDSAAGAPPVSATQAIPGTGTQRAQAAVAPAQGRPTDAGPEMTGNRATAEGGATGTAPAAPADAAHAAGTTAGGTTAAGKTGAGKTSGRTGRGSGKAAGRGPRRARLQLRHIDTWSALKISLVLSIALFFVWMVAVGILYGVLSGLGVFDSVNDLFGQVGSVSGNAATGDVITPGVVFGGAAFIGAINIVLMTALCTVGTFIYNLCSDLVGGLEVTLSERD
jgi:hypothetical protein